MSYVMNTKSNMQLFGYTSMNNIILCLGQTARAWSSLVTVQGYRQLLYKC